MKVDYKFLLDRAANRCAKLEKRKRYTRSMKTYHAIEKAISKLISQIVMYKMMIVAAKLKGNSYVS
jgi:hypothetical protein